MMFIYTADSNAVRRNRKLKDLLNELPVELHERANRYKFEADSINFVLGRLLLKEGLKDNGLKNLFSEVLYQKSGKPFLKDVYFNISHTEGFVICSLSKHAEIGIDIEKIKQVKLDDFESFFTRIEWADINSNPFPLQKFYWYWTRKESIIKALGVNLSYLHQIEVDAANDYFEENGKRWYLKDLELGDGYIGALCSTSVIEEIKIIDCKFNK